MRVRGILPLFLVLFAALSAKCAAAGAPPPPPSKPVQISAPKCTDATANGALHIVALADRSGNIIADRSRKTGNTLGLGDELAVVLDGTTPLNASCYALLLDGYQVADPKQAYFDPRHHALVYPLTRTADNAMQWVSLLGSPTDLQKDISVSLGVHTSSDTPEVSTIDFPGPNPIKFSFRISSWLRLLLAAAAVSGMAAFVWGQANRTTIMKDNLIPQIDPVRQTYSLGRWQMAVWFSLIFASYIFLYILLGDLNTLTPQALTLMGISGATALAAVEVDVYKDTPPEAINQALRLLGINSYQDVARIRTEIANRKELLANTATPVSATTAQQLSSEIVDRQLKLRTYEEQIQPYVSEGWFKDISTDINGPALHRVQVVCWTLLLGALFLFGVWTSLAMPAFSETLLALMGVSGASYVGFKFPEKQQ